MFQNDLWPNLPYLIFGALALIAGLFAVLLPETKDRALPDSLHRKLNYYHKVFLVKYTIILFDIVP